jgi:NADH-quinone oxidoreductase subunit N
MIRISTLASSKCVAKLSLVPLHFWTPDVYQGAPVNSTLLLTTLSKAAVFTLFIKLILLVPEDFEADMVRMLSWMAIASMLLGNWLALQQQSLKRLMAYSAIAHMGYVLVAGIIAMGIDHSLVLEGASYYLLAYLVASILIFAAIRGSYINGQKLACCRQQTADIRHPIAMNVENAESRHMPAF